jgi:hypothetical protein
VTPWKEDPRNGNYPYPKKLEPIDFAMDTQDSISYHTWYGSEDGSSDSQFI